MSHLDLTQRITIMTMVKEGCSLSVIARSIGKDRSTVRRELWNHRQSVGSGNGQPCPKLDRPPFVCNGCRDFGKCRLERSVYIADAAQLDYRETLVESRNGANISADELSTLNELISSGVGKGQSLHHIIASDRAAVSVSEKTMYRYVNKGLVSVKRHNLPQAPYRRPRAKLKPRKTGTKDRECLKGRTYDDWKAFIGSHPGTETVEIDSVVGRIGGKCLLTVNINCCGMMLDFRDLRLTEENTQDLFADCDVVVEAFDKADAKTMLIGALADSGIPVVAASGLAGFGKSNDIRVRKAGKNLYLVGDLVSGISPELAPASPRVGIAAAMEANTVVAILLGMEI